MPTQTRTRPRPLPATRPPSEQKKHATALASARKGSNSSSRQRQTSYKQTLLVVFCLFSGAFTSTNARQAAIVAAVLFFKIGCGKEKEKDFENGMD